MGALLRSGFPRPDRRPGRGRRLHLFARPTPVRVSSAGPPGCEITTAGRASPSLRNTSRATRHELRIEISACFANQFCPTLPRLSFFTTRRESQDALPVKQACRLAGKSFRIETSDGDCGIGPQNDALSAPAVPVEEGVDTMKHRRQRTGDGVQVQVFDKRRAHLVEAQADAVAAKASSTARMRNISSPTRSRIPGSAISRSEACAESGDRGSSYGRGTGAPRSAYRRVPR